MSKAMETYKQKQMHMTKICEEAGFAELINLDYERDVDLPEDTLFMAGGFLKKKAKTGEFCVPDYNYKYRNCTGIIYKDEKAFSSLMISIENPLEFNSEDIIFICESFEAITNEIKFSYSLMSKNIHFLIKENKKNTTQTVKRKQNKNTPVKITLNVGKRMREVKFGYITNFFGTKTVVY